MPPTVNYMRKGLYNKRQNKDIRKLRKRQHQYPEFGHTQGEIKKKPAKKYVSIQGGMKLRKPSILMVPEFHLVFLFPGRLHRC